MPDQTSEPGASLHFFCDDTIQLIEKLNLEANVPLESLRTGPQTRFLSAFNASRQLASLWELKYKELLGKYEDLAAEASRAMVARLDMEDLYELRKAEVTKSLKLETQRIDRMWSQKCAQLRKALSKEAEQRQALEQKLEAQGGGGGGVPRSPILSPQVIHISQSGSQRNPSLLVNNKLATPILARRTSSQAPEMDDEPSAAQLYTAADTGVFDPPDHQSSDEDSDPEEDLSPKAKPMEVEFNANTDDQVELDQIFSKLLAYTGSKKHSEFVAFSDMIDCGHMMRFYLRCVAVTEQIKSEDVISPGTKALAVELYETYLKSDAKLCIQLPAALTQPVGALLAEQKVEPELFNDCQRYVRNLLHKEVFPAYIQYLRSGTKSKASKFTIDREEIATTNPDLVMQRWVNRLAVSYPVHLNYLKTELRDMLQHQYQEKETLSKLRDLDNTNYWLIAEIGKGAFGSVYKGSNRQSADTVAIKVIDLEDVEGDIQTISREVATMKGKKCPQMTEYIDSAIYGTKLWITMEYMDGGSVLERITAMGSLKEKHIAIIAREVLLGLQFLASEGKIHRDIKAGNILMRKNGAVKLADFGTSRDLSDTFAKCNTQTGSPCWMAPEVINSTTSYDGKVDIWSLGITCMEMALGKAPHSELKTPMQVMRAIVDNPPPELTDKWSPYFRSFVQKCLKKDPAQRFSLQQLLQMAFIKNAGSTKKLKKLFLTPAQKGRTK